MSKNYLLVGATGLIGQHCLRFLNDLVESNQIIVLGRRAPELESPNIHFIKSDFNHLESDLKQIKIDQVLCCLGTTIKKAGSKEAFRQVDYEYPLAVAQAALKHGAQGYHLVSSIGADAQSAVFYTRTKGEIEQAIAELNYPGYTIYRPSVLLGERSEFRPGEEISKAVSKVIPFGILGPLARYKPIEAAAVARVMVQQAREGLPGQHILESSQIQNLADKFQ